MIRAVVVRAKGAGYGLERPFGEAPAADEMAVGRGRDDGEVRLPAAKRAVAAAPGRQVRALDERFGAARQKRAQRQHKHLLETPGGSWGETLAGCRAVHAGRRLVPRRHHGLERVGLAAKRDDGFVFCRFDHLVAAQDVGRLPERQPEIRPFEGDIRKADDRAACLLLGAQPGRVDLNPGQRHARLDTPLHVDQRELHIDCPRQIGLIDLELLEFDDIAWVRPRGADGTIGHDGIVGQHLRKSR